MAAISQFGSSIDGVACATIDEVFHEAESNRCDFAVVPVENSTQGTVTRTIDLLFTTSLTIIAEVNVPIHHQLMNKTGRIEDVMSVAAHPQALAQCRQWLAAHLGDAEQKSLSSNAEAARRASEDPSLAAIAAERAAQLYDLKIVAGGIQDDPRNRTAVYCPRSGYALICTRCGQPDLDCILRSQQIGRTHARAIAV